MSTLRCLRLVGVTVASLFAYGCAPESSPDSPPPTARAARPLGTVKTALLRLEDVGPGGAYKTAADLAKLRVIADYLAREHVPFHVALIPRFIEPGRDVDLRSPAAAEFVTTLSYLRQQGASIGLHGYTHQFLDGVSGPGNEFSPGPRCAGLHGGTADCPPTDEAASDPDYRLRTHFFGSWVSQRLLPGAKTVEGVGHSLDWFEAPHYHGSGRQRLLMEGWSGLIFEPRTYALLPQPPDTPRRTVFVADHDPANNSQLSRGAVYVPAPLNYVAPEQPQASVDCILANLTAAAPCVGGLSVAPEPGPYTAAHVAGVFIHPSVEMPFITLDANNNLLTHDEGSPLHRLVRGLVAGGYVFQYIRDLTLFIPSLRNINFAGSASARVLVGDVDGDADSDLVVYEPTNGSWSFGKPVLTEILRPQSPFSAAPALQGWAVGTLWTPTIGDYDGDGRSDVAVMYTPTRQVQVALSSGAALAPQAVAWLDAAPAGSMFSADATGDGRSDLVFWSSAAGTFRVAAARATGGFAAPVTWLSGWAASSSWDVLFGNIDGLPGADIVVRERTNGTWQVALARPTTATFQPTPRNGQWAWLAGWAAGAAWQAHLADIDGDLRDDLVAVRPTMGDWQFAYNRATGFAPSGQDVFRTWGAGASSEAFVGTFLPGRKASLMVRDRTLFGGTVDFATPSRQVP